jgi:hypothetical protein
MHWNFKLAGRQNMTHNEEGIKEVKKKKGLEALPIAIRMFVYLHCLLEAHPDSHRDFVYLSKPFFFLFLLILMLCVRVLHMQITLVQSLQNCLLELRLPFRFLYFDSYKW